MRAVGFESSACHFHDELRGCLLARRNGGGARLREDAQNKKTRRNYDTTKIELSVDGTLVP